MVASLKTESFVFSTLLKLPPKLAQEEVLPERTGDKNREAAAHRGIPAAAPQVPSGLDHLLPCCPAANSLQAGEVKQLQPWQKRTKQKGVDDSQVGGFHFLSNSPDCKSFSCSLLLAPGLASPGSSAQRCTQASPLTPSVWSQPVTCCHDTVVPYGSCSQHPGPGLGGKSACGVTYLGLHLSCPW